MSVPPDNFDGEQPEIPDEELQPTSVDWLGEGNYPEWFEQSQDFFSDLSARDSVMLEVGGVDDMGNFAGGLSSVSRDEFSGDYHIMLHGFDEDTGEDLYWEIEGWSYDELMDFYDYIEDYYADVSFWSENYSLAKL